MSCFYLLSLNARRKGFSVKLEEEMYIQRGFIQKNKNKLVVLKVCLFVSSTRLESSDKTIQG